MAGPVNAAKPKVKVNGAITVELGGSTQDLEAFSDAPGLASVGPARGYGMKTDAEIHINVSGKTDAGMKWKAQVQFEADANVAGTDGNNITESSVDETWIKFYGSWGDIRLGVEDGAEDLMHFSSEHAMKKAGSGGVDGHWDDFVDWTAVNSRFANEPTLKNDTSDHTKVSYFSPRVGGVQVGVSFTPDTGAIGQATNTDNSSDFENTWGLGINYKQKFGGVKVGIAGVTHIADAENETKEDLRAWMIGGYVKVKALGGEVALGGAYQDNGDGGQNKSTVGDDDMRAWDLGVGYNTGPVYLGVSYLHTEVDKGSDGEDEGDTLNFGATYMLGGGARVFAEVFWFDTESAESDGTFNEGMGFIVGSGVKF
jgi:predicted porin